MHKYQRKIVIERVNGFAAIAIGRLTRQGHWSVQNYKRGSRADILNMFNDFYNHFVETDQPCEVEYVNVDKLSTIHSLANGPHFTH